MGLTIENGSKKYKLTHVLKDINLTFEDGLIYGLVGINGSGKTLILKSLCGYISLDTGYVTQDNRMLKKQIQYIENAGIVIEDPQFLSHFTLLENLTMVKNMCSNKHTIDLNQWIKLYRLEEFIHKKYTTLSLGTKKKMALIQAFMHEPNTLILDEPMNALDEYSVNITKHIIQQTKDKGGLVIMTSHIKDSIQELCDTVYIIEEGRVKN